VARAELAIAQQLQSARDPTVTTGAVCAIYQHAIDVAQACGMRPLIAECLAGMAQACKAVGDVAAAAG
jgi:hypothetical protein